jgi:hypothetical protein
LLKKNHIKKVFAIQLKFLLGIAEMPFDPAGHGIARLFKQNAKDVAAKNQHKGKNG